MNIYITDTNEVRTIQLKTWEGNGWSPDCFNDLADTLPVSYPASQEQKAAGADAAMTSSQYAEEVAWWENEVDLFNDHKPSWFTENLDEEESAYAWNRTEYGFFAD